MGIPTPVLTHPWQVFYPLSHRGPCSFYDLLHKLLSNGNCGMYITFIMVFRILLIYLNFADGVIEIWVSKFLN